MIVLVTRAADHLLVRDASTHLLSVLTIIDSACSQFAAWCVESYLTFLPNGEMLAYCVLCIERQNSVIDIQTFHD